MTVNVDELHSLADVVRRQASCERLNAAAAAAVGGVCERETSHLRMSDAKALARVADLLDEMSSAARRSHLSVVR